MNFNFYNTLILIGVIQGFIFGAVVLFIKKYRSQSTYLLVGMIMAVSLNSLEYYMRDINVITYKELMRIYYVPFATLNCTFMYLYIKKLLNPTKKLSLKEKLLFMPFFSFVLGTNIFKIILYFHPNDLNSSIYYAYFASFHELFTIVYSLFLVAFSYKMIADYKKNYNNYSITIVFQQLNWLIITIVIYVFVILLYTYLVILDVFYTDEYTSFYSLWILNSFTIYWLGHIGIYKYGIQKERQEIRKYSIENRANIIIDKKKNSTINALEKLIIEDKMYLDSQLTLEKIATELDVSVGHLSRLVNSELNTSFTDYINLLRINEAKSHLTNPEFSNYTLAAIGLESGFNSKSTFYGTFKKVTNLTPAQYRDEQMSSKIQ